MIKHLKYILLMPLSLLLMASECKFMDPYEEFDTAVVVSNDTSFDILWFALSTGNDSARINLHWQESFFYNSEVVSYHLVKANNKVKKKFNWEDQVFNKNEKIIFYIFDKETVETVPWDTIAKYRMVLHTYEITRAYLDAHDWTIVYPPDTTER